MLNHFRSSYLNFSKSSTTEPQLLLHRQVTLLKRIKLNLILVPSFQKGFTVQIRNPFILSADTYLVGNRCHFLPRSPAKIFKPHILLLHFCPAWLKQLPAQSIIRILYTYGSPSIKDTLNITQGHFHSVLGATLPKHLAGSPQPYLQIFFPGFSIQELQEEEILKRP